MSLQENAQPGFHGKLPARGDFVGRRLSRDFLDPWDEWLQGAITDSRALLKDGWLPSYLKAPLWRFALKPGQCGARGAMGVLMSSVDGVGRYFPLTVVSILDSPVSIPAMLVGAADWLRQAETIVLRALDDDISLESFDAAVVGLGAPGVASIGNSPAHNPLRIGLTNADDSQAVLTAAAECLAAVSNDVSSFWWTTGSTEIRSVLLALNGLPSPIEFAAMLDGKWDRQEESDDTLSSTA